MNISPVLSFLLSVLLYLLNKNCWKKIKARMDLRTVVLNDKFFIHVPQPPYLQSSRYYEQNKHFKVL